VDIYDNKNQANNFMKYYVDGMLKTEFEHKDGNRHGLEKEYFKNGNLKVEVYNKNGELEGPAKFYY
tara:strand:- start:42 stop:239 length:198 start_codon:yes stop_codon:yes gene_type:complete